MASRCLSSFRRLLPPLPRTPTPHRHLTSLPRATDTTASFQNPTLRRFLSTYSGSRRLPSSRHRAGDIGARARQLQNRRLWTYALTFGCAAGFVVIVLANFEDQLVFFVTPTDVLARFAANPSKNRFRLGGLVLEGSVVDPSASSSEMEFVVTDLATDILVRYEGSLPDLFREGHSVVVEGFLKPLTDEVRGDSAAAAGKVSEKARQGEYFFQGTEVLAKHDEKYMPKEVAEAIERNRKQQKQMELAAAAAAATTVTAVAADGAKAS